MKYFVIAIFLLIDLIPARSQQIYFPPLNNSLPWDTISPIALGWCPDKIDSLYQFLDQEGSKGFIVLKDGKIVLEHYFGTFTQDSNWYWASANKTLTAFLIGQAQEEGYLSISDTSAKYLGVGWTSCPPDKEEMITIRHQLTMTTGLDDGVPDNHCTLDSCLQYLADAGTRWAYHNAPYTILQGVLENATSTPINTFTNTRLKNPTGMNGLWLMVDYDNVYFSRARSMARFGLLIQNHGVWNSDTLLHDTSYFHQMVNTSQTLNNSYGYLWWLNGKASYMLPGLQFVFPGSYAPHAPADMFSALGKNGQILSIAPSLGLVVVRMGNQPTGPGSEVPNLFCDMIWQKLISAMCQPMGIQAINENIVSVFPSPAGDALQIKSGVSIMSVEISNLAGIVYFNSRKEANSMVLNCSGFPAGIYFVKLILKTGNVVLRKVLINH